MTCHNLFQALSQKLPPDQLMPFLDQLLVGLLDVQSHCSSAACVVLHHIIKTHGGELHSQVGMYLDNVLVFSQIYQVGVHNK